MVSPWAWISWADRFDNCGWLKGFAGGTTIDSLETHEDMINMETIKIKRPVFLIKTSHFSEFGPPECGKGRMQKHWDSLNPGKIDDIL